MKQTVMTRRAFSSPATAGIRCCRCVKTQASRPTVQTPCSTPPHDSDVTLNLRKIAVTALVAASLLVEGASARPAGVNRPELLPKEPTTVIDVAGFLTASEERTVRTEVENLEKDTGYKLRVLAQNYPETPGKAVQEFWGVDDNTIVFVADPTFGDILNFNVGHGLDLEVPQSFWSRLAGKYGNKFYWQENGEAAAIMNAVSAIDTCLREPSGRFKCAQIQAEFGEQPSSGKFGKLFGQ